MHYEIIGDEPFQGQGLQTTVLLQETSKMLKSLKTLQFDHFVNLRNQGGEVARYRVRTDMDKKQIVWTKLGANDANNSIKPT